MSKKLTLQLLKSDAKKYDKKEKVQLTEDVHAFIYPLFSPTKVKEMLIEFLTDFEQAKAEKIDLASVGRQEWLFFMIIKTFADLEISSHLKNKFNTYLQIRNSDIYPLILEAFPKESYQRVVKMMDSIDRQLVELKNMDQQKLEDLVQKVVELEEEVQTEGE
ncbi:hypothetical protein SAMN05421503_1425 [Terribacillus aidingensis]|uniref:Uncharacterized protein n=1 Tax=Terribacillus aidingensis TaxID=586416 RepID=A0A285NLY3_9BACI|nr:hypothetical protein [Terribacillus aidingensis]SNZ09933.1 hypothetical protein SAMN05421503_1425 [Terribacillus aidingensis]